MKRSKNVASRWDRSTWDRKRPGEDRKLIAESRSRTRKSKSHLKDTITASKRTLRQIKKSTEALAEAQSRYLETQKMIATFMKACAPLEAYLQEGGELTERDLTSVDLTVTGLVTFLGTWKRKHTTLKLSSDTLLPAVSPSFRKSSRKPRNSRRRRRWSSPQRRRRPPRQMA